MFLFKNGIFFGLLGMLSWGVADYFAAIASRKIGSFSTFFWSQAISLAVYAGFFLFMPLSFSVSTVTSFLVIITSLLMIMAYAAFYKSLEIGRVAIGTTISACWGLITAIIAVTFLNQSLGGLQILGIAFAVSGIILTSMKKNDFFSIFSKKIRSEKGVGYGLIALAGWGVAFALVDVLVSAIDWFHAILLVKIITVALLVLWIFIKKLPVPLKSMIPTLAIVGALETAAYLAFGFGITIGQIAQVAPIISTYPIAAVILARLFLKEKLEVHQYFGIGTVLAGVVLLSI